MLQEKPSGSLVTEKLPGSHSSDRGLSAWCADTPTSNSLLDMWSLEQLLSRRTEKGSTEKEMLNNRQQMQLYQECAGTAPGVILCLH